jgi:hypothetical protein
MVQNAKNLTALYLRKSIESEREISTASIRAGQLALLGDFEKDLSQPSDDLGSPHRKSHLISERQML